MKDKAAPHHNGIPDAYLETKKNHAIKAKVQMNDLQFTMGTVGVRSTVKVVIVRCDILIPDCIYE